jgi:hypothetical protein
MLRDLSANTWNDWAVLVSTCVGIGLLLTIGDVLREKPMTLKRTTVSLLMYCFVFPSLALTVLYVAQQCCMPASP